MRPVEHNTRRGCSPPGTGGVDAPSRNAAKPPLKARPGWSVRRNSSCERPPRHPSCSRRGTPSPHDLRSPEEKSVTQRHQALCPGALCVDWADQKVAVVKDGVVICTVTSYPFARISSGLLKIGFSSNQIFGVLS